MSLELVELDVGSEPREGRVNVPEVDASGEGVVIVPGAGHGPYGNIFDIVAYELAGVGHHVGRIETWESHEELAAKTLADLHAEVDAVVAELRSRGCTSVSIIAKSFGGGIALTHVPDAVDRLLLWAPAVEFGVGAEAATDPGTPLGDSEDLPIAIDDIDVDVPVTILVGDEDRGVAEDDCERIAAAVPEGDVTVVPGENHSFNQNRTRIVAETRSFLGPDR